MSCYFQEITCNDNIKQFPAEENREVNYKDVKLDKTRLTS